MKSNRIKICLKIKTTDYNAGILESEFRNFIKELDYNSEMYEFKLMELKGV